MTDLQRILNEERAPQMLAGNVFDRLDLADRYAIADSPLGELYVAYNARGIVAVSRAASDAGFAAWFRTRFDRTPHRTQTLPAGIAAAACGERNPRRCAYDLSTLSAFEQAVLRKAQEIPPGQVRPYAWVANEIGRPRAVRAVGTALANNPVPLLIPCHRVVRTDGRIGDYIFGTPEKRALLQAEGIDPEALEDFGRRGIRYVASRTTGIYCFPSCAGARRIADRHRAELRSDRDAERHGFRPCRTCRPSSARAS